MFIVGTFNLAYLLSSIHCYLPWAALYHPIQHIFNHHCRHHHCHHNQNYHRLCITELDAFILTCLGRVINPSFHLNSGEIVTILYGVVYQTSKKRHMSHPNTRKHWFQSSSLQQSIAHCWRQPLYHPPPSSPSQQTLNRTTISFPLNKGSHYGSKCLKRSLQKFWRCGSRVSFGAKVTRLQALESRVASQKCSAAAVWDENLTYQPT